MTQILKKETRLDGSYGTIIATVTVEKHECGNDRYFTGTLSFNQNSDTDFVSTIQFNLMSSDNFEQLSQLFAGLAKDLKTEEEKLKKRWELLKQVKELDQ